MPQGKYEEEFGKMKRKAKIESHKFVISLQIVFCESLRLLALVALS
jgi:hypothetical protein